MWADDNERMIYLPFYQKNMLNSRCFVSLYTCAFPDMVGLLSQKQFNETKVFPSLVCFFSEFAIEKGFRRERWPLF